MPEFKKTSTNNWHANWDSHTHDQILIVWQVAALSLGIEPDLGVVKSRTVPAELKEIYEKRVKWLARKLQVFPSPGFVTYFPEHPFNKASQGARNRMVDVLSCIDVLVESGVTPLSPEFIALKEPLLKLPLAKQQAQRVDIGLPTNEVVSPPSPSNDKFRKSQDSRAATIKHENLHVLLYSMACSSYEYDPKKTVLEKEAIAQTIADEVPALHRGRYGLGKGAVMKILKIGGDLVDGLP